MRVKLGPLGVALHWGLKINVTRAFLNYEYDERNVSQQDAMERDLEILNAFCKNTTPQSLHWPPESEIQIIFNSTYSRATMFEHDLGIIKYMYIQYIKNNRHRCDVLTNNDMDLKQ